MGKKADISYDGKSLLVNGKRLILFGGEFHYFRTPKALWEDRLTKIKQAGCNLVTTYIPWNFHEEEEGKLNWEQDRDLPHFLRLCEKFGMYVIIKPGPYICAEWDFGGFPHWLLEKDVPLRLPDEKYLKIVKEWYVEVAKIIKPFLITNGGNIVLIQVENEYDHLIEMSEELTISQKEAREYLLTLLKFNREAGIDVPAFTNEGMCILGTEIINTHTYYPNIPWIWMWEFNDFDRKIEESRRVQPDKPLMILELETGWFAQFDKPIYNVETEVMDAITKTVIAYGASVFNYYMMAGGTSFPYWPAKGDYGGIGICTTFDFGAAPVREWGEIHEKYHLARKFSYFLRSFPSLIFEGETSYQGIDFNKGGEEIVRIGSMQISKQNNFDASFENIKIMMRRFPEGAVVLIRNLEDEKKIIRVKLDSTVLKEKVLFPQTDMSLPKKTCLLLPVDFYVGNNTRLVYSTSEIIARKTIDKKEHFIFQGKDSIQGEMVVDCPETIEVVEGRAKISTFNKKCKRINYSHSKMTILKVGPAYFIILPEKEADKLWIEDDLIMLSDFNYLKNIKKSKNGIMLNFTDGHGKNKIIIWSGKKIKDIKFDNKKISFKQIKGRYEIVRDTKVKSKNSIKWNSQWRYTTDSKEKNVDFNDKNWITLNASTPLEKARLFDHGYFWYRTDFILPKTEEARIRINSNNMDRFTVYVNGRFRWIGIGSPELEIADLVKEGKNIIAVCYENAYHTKAHPHEGPIKKLSGLYSPVEIKWKESGKEKKSIVKEWRVQEQMGGVNKKYFSPDLDDSHWITIPTSQKYVFQEDVGNIIWLRRKFKFNKEKDWECPAYLEISDLSDRCLIYVNGFLLGRYENVGPQHRFYIPENLLKKDNLITLVIEGPGFHPVKGFGFLPPKFTEPDLGFYFEARDVNVELKI
ncbi:MAG: beta-galactosidase [Spirochaetes bacterium]|nr:beta-galactosidase [Spirochaetota bacterium]